MIRRAYDAIILGLGAMGSAAAYHLARRGRRVLGIDRFRPPHSLGSSHGHSRVIRKAYFEHPDYVPLLHRAYGLWRELEAEGGRTLLRTTGALMIGAETSEVVTGTIRSALEHGLAHEVLRAHELQRRFPVFSPDEQTVGVYEPEGGVLDPEACIETHLSLASRHGADLRFDQSVAGWRADKGRADVHLEGGACFSAEVLILATGAWSSGLLPDLSPALLVERRVSTWLPMVSDRATFFGPSRLPVWVWEVPEGVFYGIPALDGAGGGVKLGIHSGASECDPDSVLRTVDADDFRDLRRFLVGRIRWIEPSPIRATVCLYTMSPDGHFIVGRHPDCPEVLIAAGFSGHGFKFACLIGEVLAEFACDGNTRHPVDLFNPSRWGGRAQPS